MMSLKPLLFVFTFRMSVTFNSYVDLYHSSDSHRYSRMRLNDNVFSGSIIPSKCRRSENVIGPKFRYWAISH